MSMTPAPNLPHGNNSISVSFSRKIMEYRKSSFLAMTNDAICTAVSKAMLLVKDDAKSRSCQKSDQTDKDFLPEISLDEVQYHDNIGDYWIVLYDRVYDITSFLQEVM